MESIVVTTLKACYGVIIEVVTFLFGEWDLFLQTIICLIILDYCIGGLRTLFNKEVEIKISFLEISRKITIFVIIALANIIQKMLNNSIPLREIVIMFYIINQSFSIIENAACFIPIPPKLKHIILQLGKKQKKDTEDSELINETSSHEKKDNNGNT